MRALRVDKLTYAALEATLIEYVAGRASDSVPVLQDGADCRRTPSGRAPRLVARRLRDAGLFAPM